MRNTTQLTHALGLLLTIAVVAACHRNSETSKTDIRSAPLSESEEGMMVDVPNALGFRRVAVRQDGNYLEGILDKHQRQIVPLLSNLLVHEIEGDLALVQFGTKFLFIPLGDEAVSREELEEVAGFQYATPYRCDLALVVLNDRWFYIRRDGQRAFQEDFDFAESFHFDRALVKVGSRYRILDTRGETVAKLDYDQVNSQSPWCWQVTKVEGGKFLSGFVDLNGQLLTDLVYEEVGTYDPLTKRIRVAQRDLYGFLDENAKVAIPLIYEYAEVFDHGKARVELRGRDFFIDPNGVELSE
ncbi:MAG: WG repeat-containing protein [Planctomycetes bacterium]|nr:WG repeat-containing protein [Planctomycetota bacterium]